MRNRDKGDPAVHERGNSPQTAARPISEFLETHFRHFNARETLAAAQAYRVHVRNGGVMFLAMAGAMSTAEIGISLA